MDEKKSVKGSRDPEGRMIFLVEFYGGGKTKKISVEGSRGVEWIS